MCVCVWGAAGGYTILPFVYVIYITSVWNTVIHSLKVYLLISSGVPNVPEYLLMVKFEDVLSAYYDSNMKTAEPRQQWVREMVEGESEDWETYTANILLHQYRLAETTKNFYHQQTGGMWFS